MEVIIAHLFVLSLNIRTMTSTIKAEAKRPAIDRAAIDTLSLLLLLSPLLLLIQLMLMSIEGSELV